MTEEDKQSSLRDELRSILVGPVFDSSGGFDVDYDEYVDDILKTIEKRIDEKIHEFDTKYTKHEPSAAMVLTGIKEMLNQKK